MPDVTSTEAIIEQAEVSAQERFEHDEIVVLLVDDQPMVGEAVRRLLANEPQIAYHYCSRSHEAHAWASTLSPTVILQDLVMPDVDGLELLRNYRAAPATRNIPVIVLSTKEEADVKRQAFELGATDYLVKLPDRIELVARIRSHSRAYLNHIQRDAAMTALNAALREKSEFLSIASHDLKNPLTVVLGAAMLLKTMTADNADGANTANIEKMIATISRQAEQMRSLIMNYLDAQAAEDGELKVEPAPADLNQIARDAASDLEPYTKSKGADIWLDLQEDLPTGLFDPARVAQVAVNIISNSVKFSPPGARIEIRTRSRDGYPDDSSGEAGGPGKVLLFEVEDNGPGLSPDDLAHLFGRYARLTARPTGGEKSTGLGLAICKSLIELQSGRIGARNNPAGRPGATFWFALPVESKPQP